MMLGSAKMSRLCRPVRGQCHEGEKFREQSLAAMQIRQRTAEFFFLIVGVHVQVTVLQIAALKKVSKGTRVLLLDRNGGAAKAIARELSRRGFRRVFVIQGGFSGWTSSKLQTKLSSSARACYYLS